MRNARAGRVALSAALLATALAAPGCARLRLRREGEAAVRAYNDAIVVAYRTNDPRGLEKVASAREVRKLTALIDLKRYGSLALESELKEMDVLGVEGSGPDGMVVRTRERWRYWDRALRPGMPAGTVFLADMWMAWELAREGGTWKVRQGRTERSAYLEPKGFVPGRPHGSKPGAAATPAAGASG